MNDQELAFVNSCGIKQVGVFAGRTQSDLAAQACKELLAGRSETPDVLILAGPRAPDVLLGSDACHVQEESGAEVSYSFTLDGLGCVGSSAAWGLARDLLVADAGREAVLITHASRPTGRQRVRYPVTVVGDGAFAMTMVRGGRPALRAHRMESDGRFHDLFQVDYKRTSWFKWREECQDPARYRYELALHSQRRVAGLVDRVLADAGIGREQITAVLMQNVSAGAYDVYAEILQAPVHPVCAQHLADLGHLGAMDVVLNLQRLVSDGDVKTGDFVLMINNSAVAAWAVTLWEI